MSIFFPHNIVVATATAAATMPKVKQVVRRQHRITDNTHTLAVWAARWTPDEETQCLGQNMPSVSRYNVNVDFLIKAAEEELGNEEIAEITKSIRAMVYGDGQLTVDLQQLSDLEYGFHEQIMRWGVREQNFSSDNINGQFVFLSNTAAWFETSITTI